MTYGIYLNERFYNFVDGSYRQDINQKKGSNMTQGSRTFQLNRADFKTHSITLQLDNTYEVYAGLSNTSQGIVNAVGVSRLFDLINFLGAKGTSMPLIFVAPEGSTHLVVPTGAINIEHFLPEAPFAGMEYRVQLTLENYE